MKNCRQNPLAGPPAQKTAQRWLSWLKVSQRRKPKRPAPLASGRCGCDGLGRCLLLTASLPVLCHSKVKMDTISGLKSRFWREQVKGPTGPGGGSDSTSTAAAGGGCATPPVSSHWERPAWEAKPNSARDLGKRGLRNNLPASIEAKQAGCMESNSYAKPIILAVIFFVVFLLSKPLQRAAHFQEPGSSKQTSLWLPAGLGRIRGWDALPLLCQLNWSHVSRWFFDTLYKGLFLMVFLSWNNMFLRSLIWLKYKELGWGTGYVQSSIYVSVSFVNR